MGKLLAGELLPGTDSWTNLFNDIRNCPGEVESAVAKAGGPFEPVMNVGLGPGIRKLLDTLDKDWDD